MTSSNALVEEILRIIEGFWIKLKAFGLSLYLIAQRRLKSNPEQGSSSASGACFRRLTSLYNLQNLYL